jgi:hypothetical protein
VAGRQPVQVHGPAGIGKTTRVRHGAHELSGHGDGVVFVSALGLEVDDVIQQVFEACYVSPGYRPGRAELQHLMSGVRACVLVDDFGGSPEDLNRLLDIIPDGTVVVTGPERTLWGHGQVIELTGLDRRAGVDLVARALGRPLDAAESAAAGLLWQAAGGRPIDLIQAAALAVADGGRFILPPPGQVAALLPRLLDQAAGTGRDVLMAFSLAPDAVITPEVLSTLLGGPGVGEVSAACVQAAGLGLLQASGEGFCLTPGVASVLAGWGGPGQDALGELVTRLAQWAGDRRTPAGDVAGHAALVTALIDLATMSGLPELGVRLGAGRRSGRGPIAALGSLAAGPGPWPGSRAPRRRPGSQRVLHARERHAPASPR